MKLRLTGNVMLLLLALSTATTALASPTVPPNYERMEILITMRDGVKLNTVIFTVPNSSEPLPFLFLRTPYGVSGYPSPNDMMSTKEMANEGYIFVFQDIRGRYKSEGKFEMMRFTRDKSKPGAIDESTDTYDTIEWLLKNIKNNNGKVGMFGVSYNAWTAMQGAVDPHPALKVISEEATPADMYLGDDFHHNGAFRLSYGFEYAFREEISKTDSAFPFTKLDTYEWYLQLGALSNVNKNHFHNKIPTWNNFVNHPDYDDFWKKQALAYRLDYPRVAVLHTAGWWDQEDFYGPLKAYALLEKRDSNHRNYFVAGPWNHGGWARGDGKTLGKIRFDQPTSEQYRAEIQAPWFAWHLKGKGDGKFPEARTFQTGSNTWQSYNSWPPQQAKATNLYMHPNGKLSFTKPNGGEQSYDAYVSDPANPVPYRPRPIVPTYSATSTWRFWLVDDQRFAHHRPDVLTWETEALEEDITITGEIFAKLFASTTGSDADWIVKLIDVYPDHFPEEPLMSGYQLMIANDVFRGRYRQSFEKPTALQPGKVNNFTIDLHSANHVFKKGHRIMVQVQSSWFPIIDRNPQTFVPNIYKAKDSDYKKATHKIFRSASFPSHIQLPLVK
ncbi:CocE/NonD family hydrolase [Pseudoflavitalea rhizosphaerae]|uniref:CocE/NonD family hydrolase n=1 Tax=Pseudoflavitalea rhizosphaerae TaxID=1884793 RepID=UPI0019D10CCC|nr:CocE/NonD family hydrolase [Pseudoflavitalea rhizosphaerae]